MYYSKVQKEDKVWRHIRINTVEDKYIGIHVISEREEYPNAFRQASAESDKDHHIAIDGMLKQDTSTVNDLSAYSHKARIRGCCEVSVLYAYDIEKMEPLCAEVFPGNSIDANSYPVFIRDNDIRCGIIVADKGFPPSKIKDELRERPELHFLTPIKRNDVRISDNNMLSFECVLVGVGGHILYKKADQRRPFSLRIQGCRTVSQRGSFLSCKCRKEKTISSEKYAEKKNRFGVIVLESDLDMSPKTAYHCYDGRWLLELVFNKYKSDECLDHTDVQGDFSVIGSEFINFLSTVATCRIIRKANQAGLLDKMSYAELMDDLSSVWRKTNAPIEPSSDDGYWVHTLLGVYEELEALGLSKPVQKPEPKKRERKPKPKDQIEPTPKRPRGRPRKDTIPSVGSL